jgi:hypothetical protein
MAAPMWKIGLPKRGNVPPLPSHNPHVRPISRKIEPIKTLEIRPFSGRRTARPTASATIPAHRLAAAVASFRVNKKCRRAGFLLRYGRRIRSLFDARRSPSRECYHSSTLSEQNQPHWAAATASPVIPHTAQAGLTACSYHTNFFPSDFPH